MEKESKFIIDRICFESYRDYDGPSSEDEYTAYVILRNNEKVNFKLKFYREEWCNRFLNDLKVSPLEDGQPSFIVTRDKNTVYIKPNYQKPDDEARLRIENGWDTEMRELVNQYKKQIPFFKRRHLKCNFESGIGAEMDYSFHFE